MARRIYARQQKIVGIPSGLCEDRRATQANPLAAANHMRTDPLVTTSGIQVPASSGAAKPVDSALAEDDAVPSGRTALWLPYIAIAGLVGFLYAPVFLNLVRDWNRLIDFSHGYFIPPFVAFLVWDQRARLRATPIAADWKGIWLVGFALLTLILGALGASAFLSRISFVLLAGSIIWASGGLQLLGKTKFMVLTLLLAIPIPAAIFARITAPLQLCASAVVSKLLPLAGVPVFRTGNILQLPSLQLEVAEACSGIRSLMSLLTVAIIFGYMVERSAWRRAVLALASIPVAIVSNVMRIFLTGLCVQYWNPDKALGFFHEFSGGVMFVISLCCLYATHRFMNRIAKGRGAA